MTDFSNLEALEVTADLTAEYVIHQLRSSKPVLILKPATTANEPYSNGRMRAATDFSRQGGTETTALEADRAADRKLYPLYVIVGWRGVIDAHGREVEFNKQNVAEFCQKLPGWIFDQVRLFASNPANFVEDAVRPAKAEELAKN